ncbi:serine/threonine-protein kinase [Nannocystis sp. SCPEA4]|uniref:serine/threonine-protein kinase n=1 Tax=Nannocystis sp. SCPEA4 TaxID=2996787 RepID=UPI00226FC1CF|nr:serine/threonine-protein kinase [Nannocystis sp. SCPEA4]MCY1060291.1 serine/threonine-protein kinase [Nannocystis sp. SCPEA4]
MQPAPWEVSTAAPEPDATTQSSWSKRADESDDTFTSGRDGARYTFLDIFARGGLGQIRRAYDHRLGRLVAVKELQSPQPGSTAERRFAREAMIAAQLEHPAIVPVHDLGRRDDGEPFYCMKLVDGRSLDDVIVDATTVGARLALLPLLVTVAEAIAYAHQRRIIHRDLKPANVLVGAFGEVWVIDWGLAKHLDERADGPQSDDGEPTKPDDGALTRPGAMMGTPRYMPPEQARGETVDTRADVYALGAMIYQTISGRRPYDGVQADNFYSYMLANPPEDVAAVAPDLPADLLAIVRTAMARDPAERYPTAKALSEDLRRFVTGRLVQVHQYSLPEIVRRWASRNRALLTTLAVSLALLVGLAVISFRTVAEQRDEARGARRLAEQQRERAELQSRRADARTAEIESMTLSLAKDAGSRALAGGHPIDALPGLLQARALAPKDAALSFMLAEALRPVDALQATLPRQADGVSSLSVDPGGERLLITGRDGSLRLWDLTALAEVATLIEPGATNTQATFDRAGIHVVALAADGTLRRFDAMTGRAREEWRDQTRPGDSSESLVRMLVDHGERLLTVRAGAAELRASATGDLVRTYPGPGDEVLVTLAPSGAAWATVQDSRLRVWTASQSAPLYDLSVPDYWFLGFGAQPNQLFFNKKWFTVGAPELSFLDADIREPLALESCGIDLRDGAFGSESPSRGLTFMRTTNGDLIVAVASNGGLSAWSARDGSCRRTWSGDSVSSFYPLPGPAGEAFATAGSDGTLALWGPAPPTSSEGLSRRIGFQAHERQLTALVSIGTEGAIVTASVDGEIKLWQLRPHLFPTVVAAKVVTAVAPGGVRLARTAPGGKSPILVTELTGDEQPLEIPFASPSLVSMVWDDEETLLVATKDVVEVWDTASRLRSGRITPPLRGEQEIQDAFPLPGTGAAAVLVGTPDEFMSLDPMAGLGRSVWSWRDGVHVGEVQLGFPFTIFGATREPVRFSVLGSVLMAWPELRLIFPEMQSVPRYTFTPDDRFVLASEQDGRLTLLELVTLGKLAELRPPRPPTVRASEEQPLFFNGAGDRFLVPAGDGALEIWDYPSMRVTGALKGHSASITHALFSPDDRFAVTFVNDSEAILWDLEAQAPRFLGHSLGTNFLELAGRADNPPPAAFSPDGELLATVDAADLVFIEPESGAVLGREEVPLVRELVFDPDGDRLYIISSPDTLIERDIRSESRSIAELERRFRAAFPHIAATARESSSP